MICSYNRDEVKLIPPDTVFFKPNPPAVHGAVAGSAGALLAKQALEFFAGLDFQWEFFAEGVVFDSGEFAQ